MLVVAGKYHVVGLLAKGGMGAVYDAIHANTGRRVALKLLENATVRSPAARTRFEREAHVAGTLRSPHVVDVLDAGIDEASDIPYIAMELLEGEDLRAAIARRGTLAPGAVLVVAAQVLSGLAAAHDEGVVHRDVKPGNVMLCSGSGGELVVKLVDFGVAKPADEEPDLTEAGDIVGSIPYMAPEQLSGQRARPESDLWSLGVVMYEALTGTRPVSPSASSDELIASVLAGRLVPLAQAAPGLAPEVARIVDVALRLVPGTRFATAGEMRAAILALLPGGAAVPRTALETGTPYGAPAAASPARRRVAVLPILVALGLVACSVALLALLGRPPPRAAQVGETPAPQESAASEPPPPGSAVATAEGTSTAPPLPVSRRRAPPRPPRTPHPQETGGRDPLDHR